MYGIFCRGGTRGGKDQFSWDQVKNAPDKTYYLGSSVKAVSGRWQEGKDVFWYTKSKDGSRKNNVQDEIRAVQEREEALMRQALGLHPDDVQDGGTRGPKKESKKHAREKRGTNDHRISKKSHTGDKTKKKKKKKTRSHRDGVA